MSQRGITIVMMLLAFLPSSLSWTTTVTSATRKLSNRYPCWTNGCSRFLSSKTKWGDYPDGSKIVRIRLASTDTTTTSSDDSVKSASIATTTTVGGGETASVAMSRLSRQNLSLDLRTIANHLDVVTSHLKSRKSSDETIQAANEIAGLTNQRISLIQQRDVALQKRKEYSAVVGKLMRLASRTSEQEAELIDAKAMSANATLEAERAESKLDEIQHSMDEMLAILPNLIDDIVPEGSDDKDNFEVYKWGDPMHMPAIAKKTIGTETGFSPKLHDDIAMALGGYKADAAVKMSGSRFVALTGAVAQLERALAMFFIDHHVTVGGYTEVSVPYIVGRSALEGTSQLPKFQADLFAISPESHTCNGEDAFLIPTAEVPVTNLHRDSVLEEEDLPLSYVAWTPCFRSEAGSYGRDTKGLIRQHQFQKVELVKITTPETSEQQHELLTEQAESCLRLLELPYRKVRLCAGDIGFSARHCYDLEVWLPGAGEYREISSCSNTGDFQARRMSLRYRPKSVDKKKSKPVLCHTINGSGLAVGRALVAVLENYQTPEGTVIIPEVLRPYMRGREILNPET